MCTDIYLILMNNIAVFSDRKLLASYGRLLKAKLTTLKDFSNKNIEKVYNLGPGDSIRSISIIENGHVKFATVNTF